MSIKRDFWPKYLPLKIKDDYSYFLSKTVKILTKSLFEYENKKNEKGKSKFFLPFYSSLATTSSFADFEITSH